MSARLASCRLIIDDRPATGSWNMAADEALLESGLAGECLVRIYQWCEPTLSIGYFQSHDDRAVSTSGLPVVRRLSGGGALIHDRELTYSCVLPPGQKLAQRPEDLYHAVHQAIINLFTQWNITLQFRGSINSLEPAEPFHCFLRENSQDLVFQGHKVLGSAQRRRKGAWLQHGSLLLASSSHLPNCPGLTDLTPAGLPSDFPRLLGEAISESIAHRYEAGSMTQAERDRAQQIEQASIAVSSDTEFR